MKRKILSVFLSCALAVCCIPMQGCSASQFDTVLNELGPAVGDILQIVAAVSGDAVNASLESKIDADVASLEKLYSDFDSAEASAKGSIQAEINAGFQTLNSDLGTVFSLAHVSDPSTQAQITIAVSSVGALVSIAEAIIAPSTPTLSSTAAIPAGEGYTVSFGALQTPKVASSNPSVSQLVSEFNASIAAAKALNPKAKGLKLHKIHNHSLAVRLLTFGKAK